MKPKFLLGRLRQEKDIVWWTQCGITNAVRVAACGGGCECEMKKNWSDIKVDVKKRIALRGLGGHRSSLETGRNHQGIPPKESSDGGGGGHSYTLNLSKHSYKVQ